MTVERAGQPAGRPGGGSIPVGPDQPAPFVNGPAGSGDVEGGTRPPDQPDPFAAGLAGADRPEA